MRLINQNGTVDVPYELCALSIGGMSGKATIYIRSKALDDRPVAFADYSSEEKAMKVMGFLQNQYLDFCCNYHAQSGVFRFPKDDEVEA